MKRSHAAGNANAKTGSIANSPSGFVRTRDGETRVFAILANDFVIPAPKVDRGSRRGNPLEFPAALSGWLSPLLPVSPLLPFSL